MVTVNLAVLRLRVAANVALSKISKVLPTSSRLAVTPQALTSVVGKVEVTVMVKLTTNFLVTVVPVGG
jgi:hypothetical protein